MKAKEFLSELFSPSKASKISWPDGRQARAKLPGDRRLIVNFISHGEGLYAIEFSVDESFEMTGGGDVSSIFATVVEAVKQFVQHKGSDLTGLFFTAEQQSRAKMYDTLAKRVAKQVGWHIIPYDNMVADEKYRTALSYGDFLFAIEPGETPEEWQDAQKPQHGEFMPVFYVYSAEFPELTAIKIKAKKSFEAERWVIKNVPEYKDVDVMGVFVSKVPPEGRPIEDMGTVPEKPKPIPQDPNSLGARLRAKLDTPK
jgi:hypothetical protein